MNIKILLIMILIAEVNCNILPKLKKFMEINLINKYSEGKASTFLNDGSIMSNSKTLSLIIQNTTRIEAIRHTTLSTDVVKVASSIGWHFFRELLLVSFFPISYTW